MFDELQKLLEDYKSARIGFEQALEALKKIPFENLGFARVDHHREMRKGIPEAIFGMGKTPEQIAEIVRSMSANNSNVLITRTNPNVYEKIKTEFPSAKFHAASGTIAIRNKEGYTGKGKILIISAGTADIPVAEEAAVTADLFGNETQVLHDVGVAGLHRLLADMDLIRSARVIIVAAGMEGALPSVVAGLVSVPVIGIPTSMGYGTHLNGFAPLLAMLNSCAGIAVVNVDNGYGAAQIASLINHL
ncbi:nickel pincer cofactor biosynthesis protein LarB [bacterium]|nr:nickel pincer cofactor biosynthesis protein LarB [bacterium]